MFITVAIHLLKDVSSECLAMDSLRNKPVIVEATHEPSGGVALLSQVSFTAINSICLYTVLHCITVQFQKAQGHSFWHKAIKDHCYESGWL